MATRIRVSGYINIDSLDADQIDLNDSTGLSAAGFEAMVGMNGEPVMGIDTLDDLSFTLEK